MLQKEPSDRYVSLHHLTADLEALLDGRPPVHALRLVGKDAEGDDGAWAGPVRGAGVPARRRTSRLAMAGALAAVTALVWGATRLDNTEPTPAAGSALCQHQAVSSHGEWLALTQSPGARYRALAANANRSSCVVADWSNSIALAI